MARRRLSQNPPEAEKGMLGVGSAESAEPVVSTKKILGYISGVAVLRKEDYLNPVTKKMYQRFHLVDGTTQVLSDDEVGVLYKEAK